MVRNLEKPEVIQPKDITVIVLTSTLHPSPSTTTTTLSTTQNEEHLYEMPIQRGDDAIDTPDIKFNPTTDAYVPQTAPSIRAATISRLVERLAYDRYSDINYLKSFMMTYRSFMTPYQLLEKLTLRYFAFL